MNNPELRHALIKENLEAIVEASKEYSGVDKLTILQIEVSDYFGSVIAKSVFGDQEIERLQQQGLKDRIHYCVYLGLEQKEAAELVDFSAPNAKKNILNYEIPSEGFLLVSMAGGGNSYAMLPHRTMPGRIVTSSGVIAGNYKVVEGIVVEGSHRVAFTTKNKYGHKD